ncbi:MAG: DUF4112 domain-containing protein [Planctomycetota bacterium]|nr:MAG: DUF4112 domain-containing protein [Planctomycetota bacterium]
MPPDVQQRLQWIRRVATALDSAWRVPGTNIRFGADSLLGLVPGVGDVAGAAISLGILHQARRIGASRWTLARMTLNVVVDMLLGAIPLVGDLFDVAWKGNLRNVRLLEETVLKTHSRTLGVPDHHSVRP